MIRHVGWSMPTLGMMLLATTALAADPKEELLLPIERKISTFTIRVTKTGYTHFASADKAPAGSVPAKIIAISGRTSKDIWMLTDTAVVLQDDGNEIKFRQAKPCKWGEYNREFNSVGTHFHKIVADENNVHVFGEFRDANTRIGAERRATLDRNGKWSCVEKSLVPELTQSSGTFTWRAAYNMDDDACRIGSTAGHCSTGPRFAPTHVDPPRDSIDMGIRNVAMWMQGPDDGWVATLDENFKPVLYRFNGITWVKQTRFDDGINIHSMWADPQGQLWITAGAGSTWDTPAQQILRYDGKNLTTVTTPNSFVTKWVRGHSSRDIWFGGANNVIYQWDGSRLRQGKVPGEVSDMWVSSDGVVFFVLPDAIAFAAPNGETR